MVSPYWCDESQRWLCKGYSAERGTCGYCGDPDSACSRNARNEAITACADLTRRILALPEGDERAALHLELVQALRDGPGYSGPDGVRRASWKAAWRAWCAHVGQPQPVGRPPRRTLADLTTREVADAIYGTPTVSQTRAVGYALAGRTDLGVARLHALLEARPELDARAVVAALAGAMGGRERAMTAPRRRVQRRKVA